MEMIEKRRIGLVIFDCDGVLVDSEPLMRQVVIEKIAEFAKATGRDTDLAEITQLNATFQGLFMGEMLQRIGAFVGTPVPDTFEAEIRQRSAQCFQEALQPIPGVEALMDALDAAGIPYCVGSNGPQEKMEVMFKAVGFYDRLAGRIFSAHDPVIPKGRQKPHPDLYLHAAKVMGVAPEACVVIDDTPLGASAGVAAGMRTIGYAGETPPDAIKAVGAEPVATMGEVQKVLLDDRERSSKLNF